ncbi:TadE family protein [Streptomyces aculeolatus]
MTTTRPQAPAWLRRRLDACRGDGGGGGTGPGSGRHGVGGGDRGMSAIEFVLLTPVLYFMIFSTVQFGLYFFADHVAQATAQHGAREARRTAESNPGGWQGQAQQAARDRLNQVGPKLLTSPDIRVYEAADDRVGVEVEGSVVNVFPFIDLKARAESEGPIERFVPDLG